MYKLILLSTILPSLVACGLHGDNSNINNPISETKTSTTTCVSTSSAPKLTFTLTWDNDTDLDLHVSGPENNIYQSTSHSTENIYWAAPHGVSSYLDADIHNGQGAENIIFPAGHNAGNYSIDVYRHAGNTANVHKKDVNFTVAVSDNGTTSTYSGHMDTQTDHIKLATYSSSGCSGLKYHKESASSHRVLDSSRALADAVNMLRFKYQLHAIPFSPNLSRVAQLHAADLELNLGTDTSTNSHECSEHSWSRSDKWLGCCHRQISTDKADMCMYNKPKQIVPNTYPHKGSEIVISNTDGITPEEAINRWISEKGKEADRSLLLSDGIFYAIGAAVSQHYAVVWFGNTVDTEPE